MFSGNTSICDDYEFETENSNVFSNSMKSLYYLCTHQDQMKKLTTFLSDFSTKIALLTDFLNEVKVFAKYKHSFHSLTKKIVNVEVGLKNETVCAMLRPVVENEKYVTNLLPLASKIIGVLTAFPEEKIRKIEDSTSTLKQVSNQKIYCTD